MAPKKNPANYAPLQPGLQVSFYYRLQAIKERYLFEAMKQTIAGLRIADLDTQLAAFVSSRGLRKTASFGLRGEVLFAMPCVLEANPFLLGYYRLLLGFSQKEFYSKGPFGRFKVLEEAGEIPPRLQKEIGPLCRSLAESSETLVDGLDEPSVGIVHDLQLLTLGPQLRGGENTRIGQKATKQVRDLILKAVGSYVRETTPRTIRLENDSGRTVMIEFASDPDVRITQKLPSGTRSLVSIEIKGGNDASNIHNRLGEAEKSHLKAKALGCFEFWTILGVPVEDEAARRGSPTTGHFFHLGAILKANSAQARKFKELLASLAGIKACR